MPDNARFQARQREFQDRFISVTSLLRLEYGEAHVAIRAGRLPEQPDNVVQPFFTQRICLVAHRSYIDEFGTLTADNLTEHRFIGSSLETPRAPFLAWLQEMVPESAIVFRTNEMREVKDAVMAGIGIGFIASWDREDGDELVEVLPSLEEWNARVWLVTHMDLHRTAKVQTFLRFLKDEVKSWQID